MNQKTKHKSISIYILDGCNCSIWNRQHGTFVTLAVTIVPEMSFFTSTVVTKISIITGFQHFV